MNNNIKCVLAFMSGAAIGSAITWKLLKSKYEQLTREGIESYKEAIAYQNIGKSLAEGFASGFDGMKEEANLYAEKLKTLGYTEAEPDVEVAMPEDEIDENEGEEEYEPMSKPYVINPINYAEKDDYGCENLAYYSDGVLADINDEPVDNIEELVGDALDHFGDYEEDAVHVRNERLKCDYEILRDDRTFSEYVTKKVQYRSEE